MSIIEYILSAFRCLTASKMRTFLTTLGIIVGISSVILINTIGSTISKTMGTLYSDIVEGNQFAVMLFNYDKAINEGDMSGTVITDEMIEAFEDEFDGRVKRVTYAQLGQSTLISNEIVNNDKKDDAIGEAPIYIFSCSPNYYSSSGIDMIDGRFLTDEDVEKSAASVVICEKTADKLFGNHDDCVGKQVNVGSTDTSRLGLNATIVGVYKDKAVTALLGDTGDSPQYAYFTYSCAKNAMGIKSLNSNDIQFIAPDDISSDEMKEAATELFTPYLAEGEMVYTQSSTDQADMINTVINVLTVIIAAIAAISLIVGGIGVMNIMLVSVNERTMEIGVRKAMGADNKSIRIQFITESVVISLIGSVLGIIIGLVEAKLLAMVAIKFLATKSLAINIDLSVPVSAIIGSVIFSFVVGLVFGVYPADKAAKMEVVDALRYE